MKCKQTIAAFARHFLVSFILLGAFLLVAQQVSASVSNTHVTTSINSLPVHTKEVLQQVPQKISMEATLDFATVVHYPQLSAVPFTRHYTFSLPPNAALPPYAPRAPGACIISRIFPISIQPQAP